MRISPIVFAGIIVLQLGGVGWAQDPSILDDNDANANAALHAMTMMGDLHQKRWAEAWVVLSTVALGMGTEKCNFPTSDDNSFMWKPALDGMSSDEIYTLNRLVTSNYRNAERNGRLLLDHLFPVTRQAVLTLSDKKGNPNCKQSSEIWSHARIYIENKGQK